MCRVLVLLLFTIVFNYFSLAQSLFTIKADIDFVEIDFQQNIYIVKGAQLSKFSSEGIRLYNYSNKIYGNISMIDVSNPLRIMVFFKESNQLLFLNQQLSPLTENVDLYSLTNIEALAAGASNKGGFWVYAEDNQALMHFDSQWKKDIESQNLVSWIGKDTVRFIREFNQMVYVGLGSRVLVFDLFGLYLTTIHFNNAISLIQAGNCIVYHNESNAFKYNLLTSEEVRFPFSDEINARTILVDKNRMYLVTKKLVQVSAIQNK